MATPATFWRKLILLLTCMFALSLISAIYAAEEPEDIGLTLAEKTWLTFHPKIRVGPDSLYKPVEFIENGKHSGVTGDYYDLLSKKLGVEFVLSSKATWSESLQALLDGELDVLPAVQQTPERLKILNFTDPYLFYNTVVVTSKATQTENLRLDDLNGKKIAVVEGYFWNELLPKDYPEIEIVKVPSLADGLTITALGSADALLSGFATASYYIAENDISNLSVAGLAPYQIEYASAVRKDWPELASILNKAIKSITPEEHAAIRGKWITLDYEPPFIGQRTAKIVLGLLALTGLLALGGLLWSTSLQRQVYEKTKELKNFNESLEFKVYERTEDLRRAHERLRHRNRSLTDTNIRLDDEVHRDELTGIANRRRLDMFLAESAQLAQTMGIVMSVVMVDIDYFKYYNDHYGHLIGDDCLREVAQTLNHYAKRTGELAARFGGEEFTLVMPSMDKERSIEYAESVLQAIRDLQIENIKSPAENKLLTISIGIYTHYPVTGADPISPDKMLELGDKALYAAKDRGRDQVVHYANIADDADPGAFTT